MRRTVLVVLSVPLLLLALALAVELLLRSIYTVAAWRTEAVPLLYERVYWATPPWVQQQSILYEDPELGRWMRPDSHRTYVNLFGPIPDLSEVGRLLTDLAPPRPDWVPTSAVWDLDTNALGLRDDRHQESKPPGRFRVAMLGDSWTVGVNVPRGETIPDRLERLLVEAHPEGDFEVVNWGVIGAGVATGLRVLPRVLATAPDVVVIAYAQNDEADASRPRKEAPWTGPKQAPFRLAASLRGLELFRLYGYWNAPAAHAAGETIRRALSSSGGVPFNTTDASCSNAEVSRSRYADGVSRLVGAVQERGVAPVLVYNNVPEFRSHCTGAALREIASRHRVPLVDSSTLLAAAATRQEADFEKAIGLDVRSAANGSARVKARAWREAVAVFRVDMSTMDAPGQPAILGDAPGLGDLTPNVVPLHDDGTHGDQIAGDRVYSLAVALPAPKDVTYTFTNGDRVGEWVGLESYRPRVFALRAEDRGKRIHLPVARFGRRVLRSDASHPDAEGYALIAMELMRTLQGGSALAAYLRTSSEMRARRDVTSSKRSTRRGEDRS